jgi:hypothetical protein
MVVAQCKISAERLKRILKRQTPQRWGAEYEPSIRATPQEAPSISRARQLKSKKLGRLFHLHSDPEFAAGLLALYNPNVFDIQEQRMLFPSSRIHPLNGHPFAAGLQLPPFRGTVIVADELGVLAQHPKVFVPQRGAPSGIWVPFPFIGDLLLFLVDEKGPYCVNWPVKDRESGFTRRGPRLFHKPARDGPDPAAVARQKIEERYYRDAGTRTVQISEEHINPDVIENLRDLFGFLDHEVAITDEARVRMIAFYQRHIGTNVPCFELLLQIQRDFELARYDAMAVLKAAIWNRQLAVDLYEPILMDRPLRATSRDVLVDYVAWFHR